MDQTSLTRRTLAGAASLAIGAAAALAFASPASAQQVAGEVVTPRGVTVTGGAECDPDNRTWTVTWTVTNTSAESATIIGPDGTPDGDPVNPDVAGFNHNDVFGPNESKIGTQTVASGTGSASFEATLRWADAIGNEEFATDSDTVELGDCPSEPKDPPKEPQIGRAHV